MWTPAAPVPGFSLMWATSALSVSWAMMVSGLSNSTTSPLHWLKAALLACEKPTFSGISISSTHSAFWRTHSAVPSGEALSTTKTSAFSPAEARRTAHNDSFR